MKKIKYIIGLTFLITTCVHAQDNKDYKVCVKEFYKLFFSIKKVTINDFSKVYSNSLEPGFLIKENSQIQLTYLQAQKEVDVYSDTITSRTLLRMRVYKEQLTQGLNYESICKQIEESPVYNEGTEFSMLLELKLTERNIIFFELNKDTPKQIQYIWLSSGESLGDLVQGNKTIEKLKRPGIINDPDGYSNVRDKPDKNSQITAKFIKDEVFYYTPTNDSDWWCVYKEEGGKQVGYIHKSRILKYADFPPKLKEKVKKQRGGC
jgi:hypothetical protein